MSDTPEQFEFSNDWSAQFKNIWEIIFRQFLPDAGKLLEIGSYEGGTAVWLVKNGFPPDADGVLYCIDSWQGGIEHDKAAMIAVERRFDRNIALAGKYAPRIKVHKVKQTSREALVRLLAEGHSESFDFVYVDGGHHADEVLADLVLSFALCKPGGIIVCDDYLWNYDTNPALLPKMAIDSFVNCFSGKVTVLGHLPLYQLYLRKNAP